MKSYGYIYIHKNKENGHVYIGQSIQEPERRFRKGAKALNSYKTCPAMYAALQKYGWEGFETKILAWAVNQETLNKLEEFYIKMYQSADGTHGYNSNWFSEGRGKQANSTKEKIRQKRMEYLKYNEPIRFGPPRKLHQFFEDGEYKHCSICKIWKLLIEFGSYCSTWDKLHRKCKQCHNIYRRQYPYKRKTGLGSPA